MGLEVQNVIEKYGENVCDINSVNVDADKVLKLIEADRKEKSKMIRAQEKVDMEIQNPSQLG